MRKNVFGRQFSRDANERKQLFKSLISSLILDESIQTTVEKAKSIKGDVDRIVNKAKKGDIILKTQLLQKSLDIDALNKVIKDIAPRFKDRNSGYTRIIKLGRRLNDNAAMAIMEWVVKPEIKNEELKVKNDVKGLPAGKVEKKPEVKKAVKKVAKKETKRKAVKK